MKLIVTSILGLSVMTAMALAGNPVSLGLADPVVVGPKEYNCQRLPKSNISERMARHLNRFYPQCGPFEGKKTERKPNPRPEPCMKRIEAWKGAVIYVPCGHVLLEGQSE